MLKLVSFDVWNTLLSIESFYRNIAKELSDITERPQTILEKKLFHGYRELKAIRRSGGFKASTIVSVTLIEISKILDVDSEDMRKAIIKAVTNIPPQEYVLENAKDVLEFAKKSNLKVVVVGNVVFWPGSYNKILLEKAGFSKYIDAQFYADEVGFSKPKPEIFAKMLSELEVKPEEGLHIGDDLFEDFVGALLSSMYAVLIDKAVENIVKLSDERGYIISNIKWLESIMMKHTPRNSLSTVST
ncbi:MAG: HAD-IA family hydrolase [Nitrososphaeria archaeon]|nr:HAD-IA family hydrolase [Nitrososphaeria archaeon]NIN52568.1 HAD-IA family hydrolase [Nitrososphaeria archaeon]